MPAPAAFAPLVAVLVHLAFGGQRYVDQMMATPGLVATLVMILEEDGSQGAGDAVRHARWQVRGEVLLLFGLVCRRGRKAAQSLLSQGGAPLSKSHNKQVKLNK
jgi:hypothetical protein